MDDIDGTGHYERSSDIPPPSLLAIVLDTNPYAWSTLESSLPLSKAVADLLVFINAHLAFNHANKVAVIASHCGRTAWLYPSHSPTDKPSSDDASSAANEAPFAAPSNPNKYSPFALVERQLLRNLQLLFATTDPTELAASPTNTMLSGALTLALSYINKTMISISNPGSSLSSTSNADSSSLGNAAKSGGTHQQSSKLTSRILVVSVSGDLAGQYIPIMNLIFAAQHSRIPIDILKLAGDTVLLQQASYTTSGIFLSPLAMPSSSNALESSPPENGVQRQDQNPGRISILSTLLFAFLPDATARQHLIPPTGINVDFRAACFCHRRVVDIGFVCSICLSIFCEEGVALGMQGSREAGGTDDSSVTNSLALIRDTGACLTCGTALSLRALNKGWIAGGLVVNEQPKIKKKKKKRREETNASAT